PGDSLPVRRIPDLNGLIQAGRGDTLSIGRPGQSGDTGNVAAIDKGDEGRLHIPYLHGAIMTAGGNAPSIRRPCNGVDGGRLSAFRPDRKSTRLNSSHLVI